MTSIPCVVGGRTSFLSQEEREKIVILSSGRVEGGGKTNMAAEEGKTPRPPKGLEKTKARWACALHRFLIFLNSSSP